MCRSVLAWRVLARATQAFLVIVLCLCGATPSARGFAYLFSDSQGAATVTHPRGYTGAGGLLTLRIGIQPGTLFADEMIIPLQNAIFTWNELLPTTGNLLGLGMPGFFDFESALLHELGHALGLEHPNLGTESGFLDGRSEYTRTTKGADGVFNLGPGLDGVFGSRDDLRGDDVNLNWFPVANNNPFTLPGTVDSSTYSFQLSALPIGSSFSANASRQVAAITPGIPANTEAVMQQGTFANEVQRTLGHDDVAGIRYAMAGLDGKAGTNDDYALELVYAGLTSTADVVVKFDNARTSFAVADYSATRIGSTSRLALNVTTISFNSTQPWHFNQQPVPEPSAAMLLVAGASVLCARRFRRC
jgi:hypothetical protein